MTTDVMSRLAAANPITEPPVVESAERLRRLIEDEAPSLDAHGRSNGRHMRGRGALAGSLLAVGACAAGLLLAGGSSGPGVNVAAAAYAATSPRPGIVEAVFVARSYKAGKLEATLRQREWIDAATGQRRELNTVDEPGSHPPIHQVNDWVFAPGLMEEWHGVSPPDAVRVEHVPSDLHVPSGSRFQQGQVIHAIHEIHIERVVSNLTVHPAFQGISLDGAESIEFFRTLYRKGWMRLVGRERRAGRLLWKLESRPVGRDAHTRLIVLVDPKTFLPVTERQIDVRASGRATVAVESNLVRYRHLAAGEADGKLFDLAAQHPGARVVTVPGIFPRFRSLRAQSLPHGTQALIRPTLSPKSGARSGRNAVQKP